MPRSLIAALALCLLALAFGLWLSGGLESLAAFARDQQRQVQDGLAMVVRALKGGQSGAWTALISVCFGYGFFHAVGPGHGKAVIGAYGLTRRVPMVRLTGLALASSLAQAATAIILVAGGSLLLGWSRTELESIAETKMLPLSYILVAGLGLWLVWRGYRGIAQKQPTEHHHHHDHGADCGCGHAHGPTIEQAEQTQSFRDAGLLIAAIAMRPCSGALLLLVLTFALGIPLAGIAGTFAMGLGTASVTIATAVAAATIREGGLFTLTGSRFGAGLARTIPWIELTAGLAIAGLSVALLLQTI